MYSDRAHRLLYNGILGDKRPDGGNVLTRATLALLRAAIARKHPRFARETPGYPLTVYGEQSRLTPATLARERVEFKQTPYDVNARAGGDAGRRRTQYQPDTPAGPRPT